MRFDQAAEPALHPVGEPADFGKSENLAGACEVVDGLVDRRQRLTFRQLLSKAGLELCCVYYQDLCKPQFPRLPLLTYFKYAALRS
jgi:hypothetical protein